MHYLTADLSLPILAAWTNAVILGVAGILNWFDIRALHQLYERWNIPVSTYRISGLLQISAAIFLAVPHLRAWGIVLAAALIFGSVVILLHRGQYSFATAVIVMLVALGPATFAIPIYENTPYTVASPT